MALDYCEVCGVMLDGSTPSHPVQDAVICGPCFTSRRTQLVSDQGPVPDGPLQFHCCYCQRLLRLKPVTKRTRVRCPTCNDTFYLHGDGRVEAKLEGSRTAVLQQDTIPLQPPTAPDASKTQPLKRPEFPPSSVVQQEALLSDLAPKRLDFLDDLPSSRQAVVDTGAFASAGPGLDLVPDEDVGSGGAHDSHGYTLQEGEIDLEPEALRERVERQRTRGGAEPARRGRGGRKSTGRRPARSGPPKQQRTPAERKERKREREKEQRVREQKLEAAEARGEAKQTEAEKKVLASVAWLALWLLPLALSLGAAFMASRGQGVASRGAVADLLQGCGEAAATGVASVQDMLFPE